MLRYPLIAGLALLAGVFCAPCAEARAGLFAPDQFAEDAVWAEAASADASSASATGGSLKQTGLADSDTQMPAPSPTDDADDPSSFPSGLLRRVASQPAQGSSGATGSGASAPGGTAPAAILSAAAVLVAAAPSDRCVDRENAVLPSPPTSDLLRPPRHSS